jgi:hypothetical protein
MAAKQSNTSSTASPKSTDDFSLIRGIGPVLAGRLHNSGIHTYHELASMSPAKLAAHIKGLSTTHIARQNWIGQARKLDSKNTPSKLHQEQMVAPATRQHYENFTIEVLLDEKNKARRTRVVHVQSGDADTWAGWEPDQLIDFLGRHSKVHNFQKKLGSPAIDPTGMKAVHGADQGPTSITIIAPDSLPAVAPITKLEPARIETVANIQSPPTLEFAEKLCLCDLYASLPDSDIPISFIQQGQPYRIRLTLDASHVGIRTTSQAIYKAKIIIRQIGGSFETVLESNSSLALSGNTTLSIPGTGLLRGTYRLDAVVRLVTAREDLAINAFLEGNVLQVY